MKFFKRRDERFEILGEKSGRLKEEARRATGTQGRKVVAWQSHNMEKTRIFST